VKKEIGELRSDYKTLLWAGVSGVGFVIVAIAGGYLLSSERDERLFEKLSELQVAVERGAVAQAIPAPAPSPVKEPVNSRSSTLAR
jgi:hypothetical protein